MIDEVSAGDPGQAESRFRGIDNVPHREITVDGTRLADALLTRNVIPQKRATDAAHISIAAPYMP